MEQLSKLYEWALKKPHRKAITGFVMYVPIFCFARLLAHTQDFLDDFWHEIGYGIIFGVLTAILIYLLELKDRRG
ncbi:MAG: hypothetical protein GY805_19995 [Chloroflexi bacterium]|nr:hypothetical protein [Chloroflexota bacterium]